MPNWCENKLEVENATPEFVEYLKKEGFSFAKMNPIENPVADDSSEIINQQIKEWGTKWDLEDDQQQEVANSIVSNGYAYFLTAWSPPIEAIVALSVKFPEVDFILSYFEGGMFFWGVSEINDGFYNDVDYSACQKNPLNFLVNNMGYDEDDAKELWSAE